MIQALLDATPIGGICTLPGGVIDVAADTVFTIPHSMTIVGNGTEIRVAGDQPPNVSLFNADSLANGSRLEIRDLTIIGPDTTGWDHMYDLPAAAISWSLYKTWDSVMTVENVTTSGGYGSGILRSGGGRLDIRNCDLGAWETGVAFFDSHGGHGAITMVDTQLTAGHSKATSVGAYIHPHLDVDWRRITATGWNRYACYLNGNPQSAGHHTLIDVSAQDCSLIQTGSASRTTLVRCAEMGSPSNGGSFIKGDLTSVGSVWCSDRPVTFLEGNRARRFVGDYIAPRNMFTALGRKMDGTIDITDCHVHLADYPKAATFISTVKGATTEIAVTSCDIVEAGTGRALIVQGGSVRLIDTQEPAKVYVADPGTIEVV